MPQEERMPSYALHFPNAEMSEWFGAVLLFLSPYHGVLVVKGCARYARLRLGSRLRPLTTCAAP